MVNIYDAKARLSDYVDAAGRGERVIICRHNRPVAELRAVEPARTAPRDLTPMYPGVTFTTASFFEPLPLEEIDAWEGRTAAVVARVAERRPAYPSGPGANKKRRARR